MPEQRRKASGAESFAYLSQTSPMSDALTAADDGAEKENFSMSTLLDAS